MENQEFDQLARESAGAPTRRTLVRGLAAVLGAAGIGVGLDLDAEAKKSKKQKRKERMKKQKQKEKKKDKTYECEYKDRVCATPTNLCQAVACEDHKCVSSNVANGTACGGGRTCTNGTCSCANGTTCDVSVSPSAMNGWLGYDDKEDEENNSILQFVTGPGTPLHGPGSVQMTVEDDLRYNIATRQFGGTKLADITQLKLTNYNASATNHTGDPQNTSYLQFNVDFNGSDTWQKRLIYVPSKNGTVIPDTWQEWDAINGGSAKWMWSDFGGKWPDESTQTGDDPKTWDEILADYPNAEMLAGDAFLGVRVGNPDAAGFTGNVGSVTLAVSGSGSRFVFGPDS